MKIGIESAAYFGNREPINYEEGFRKTKEHGYDCVDFQIFCDTDFAIFRMTDEEFDREMLRIRRAAEEAGVEIWQTHAPWRWPSRDATEEDRAERFEKYSRSLHGTAMLGSRYMVIHPLLPFKEYDGPDADWLWNLNVEFFSRLVKVAEREQVVLCFENMPMPQLTMATPKKVLEFVKTVNSPWFKVCLDTGHCTMCCGEESVGDQVRLIGKEYLATLHVHDNDGRRDGHTLPYTGVIDWADFRAALKEIGFDGCVSLEAHINKDKMPETVYACMEKAMLEMAKSLAE